MLFVFGEMRNVMMWMQNTPSPLDMVFLDDTGHVSAIHENAVPFSEATISSQGPAAYVVELLAGTVKRTESGVGTKRPTGQFVASVAANLSKSLQSEKSKGIQN